MIQVPRRRLGWRVTAGILAALLSAPARWRTPTETDAGCVSCAPATSRRMFPYATLHPGDVRQPRAMGASAPMHASKGHGQPGPVDCDYVPQLTLRGSAAASRPARYQGYIRRLPLLIVARLFIIGAADAVRRGPGALVSARGRGWYFAAPANARVVLAAFLKSGIVRVPPAGHPAVLTRPGGIRGRASHPSKNDCLIDPRN